MGAAGPAVGPAARPGDQVQITKVDIDNDKIEFQLNGGAKGKKSWLDHVQVGMGGPAIPLRSGASRREIAASGTSLALLFDKSVPGLTAAEYKKMLAPILDFEKRTATEQVMDSLPPEVAAAVKENRAIEGMTASRW